MTPKKRLGEMLIDAGVIDPTQLQAALGFQRQWGVRLGQALVDLKLASEPQIVDALAKKFGFTIARLDAVEPYALEQALKLVPGEFAFRNNVLPMAADPGSVTVAMSDPTNLSVVDEVSFRTGRRVKVQIGGDREIAAALKRHYPSARKQVEAIALDLEAEDAGGEPVLDPFGGGSKDALEAFFGSAPLAAPAAGAPAPPPPAPAAPAAPAEPLAELVDLEPELDVALAREALLGEVPGEGFADAVELTAEDLSPADLSPADLSPADDAPEAVVVPAPRSRPEAVAAPAATRAPPGEPAPPDPAPGRHPDRPLTDQELAILGELERVAGGGHADPAVVKPAQAMAAVIRLLIRRRIITEREFLDALLQK